MLEEGQKTTVEVGSLLLTLSGLTQVPGLCSRLTALLGHLASHKSYSVNHWATNDSRTYNLLVFNAPATLVFINHNYLFKNFRMDATLKELTSLVKEVYPEARKKGTHFNFAIVFMDLKRPGYRVKEIGSTMSGRKGTDDSMTLQSQKFQIGDYLDIAITPPNRAPPSSGRMRPY